MDTLRTHMDDKFAYLYAFPARMLLYADKGCLRIDFIHLNDSEVIGIILLDAGSYLGNQLCIG